MVLLLASTLAREDVDPEAEGVAAGELAAELLLDAEPLHAARSKATVALPSTPATRLVRTEDPIKTPLYCFGGCVTTVPVGSP